ncbi:MAG: polysaccharide deacetylase family protein [Owenweeksia sp.]
MVLIYVEKATPRFRYIAQLIFRGLLGLELRITTDKEEYLQTTIPKINYSKNPMQSGLYIQAENILFESDIFDQEFQVSEFKDVPVFFLSGNRSQLPYDPLAASFYLVSRYEEYMPFIADEHNRFPARESFMFKNGVLNKPLVNIYARHLEEVLLEFYPNLEIKRPTYSFINTIDIDNAFAYLGKGIFRTFGGLLKNIMALNFDEVKERFRTLAGLQKDPFETFEWQLELQEKYKYRTIYFALFARLSQFDRSLSLHSPRLHRYIKSINDFCEVGIHPSYRSNSSIKVMEEELLGLERVLNIDITRSRQHFLMLKFPETYRNLLKLEITDDYTMGFAAETGFRAGICTPFRFYDLEMEVETPLTVHPFPFMDGTFIYYKNTLPDIALSEIKDYIRTYREYGGEFIPIWHNRIFSEKMEEWAGWNHVFEEMVKAAV